MLRRTCVKAGGGGGAKYQDRTYKLQPDHNTFNAIGAGRYAIPFLGYFGHLLKDVAGRLTKVSHGMRSSRLMVPVPRHQNVKMYKHMIPDTLAANYVAPTAAVTGNVQLGYQTQVFYHACIRNYHVREGTVIGDNTSILERCTLIGQVRVGNDTIVGVGSTLDCCEVHNNVHIGSRVHVCLGSVIENGAIIASGSVVTKDTRVPAGEIWAGNPAEKVGVVSEEQASEVAHQVEDYKAIGASHNKSLEAHINNNAFFDQEWLSNVCKQIESRQKDVMIASASTADVPIEARQFMKQRVSVRRPLNNTQVSYPSNQIAPWLARPPDWNANV